MIKDKNQQQTTEQAGVRSNINKVNEAPTLPPSFVDYTYKLFGKELFEVFLKGFTQPAPSSIRLNNYKLSAMERDRTSPLILSSMQVFTMYKNHHQCSSLTYFVIM